MPETRLPLYLDTMASTPVDPRVAAAMAPFWSDTFGNPHSNDHQFGWNANAAVAKAAAQVARLIGADTDEIIFTSGATEANNLAILGLAHRASRERRRILVSAVEHKCMLAAAHAAAQRYAMTCEYVAVDSEGRIDLDDLDCKLGEDVLCVAAMAVNNEIGTVQDISAVGKLCSRLGAILICDAVQAPAAIDVDVTRLAIGALTLSAHKLYGPKGIGALYLRHDLVDAVEPLIYGGGQQKGLRSGTLPTPLCVGFGAAAEIAGSEERHGERARINAMRDAFEAGLLLLDEPISFNGRGARRHPGNSNVRFRSLDARHLLSMMQPDLAAATGSACSSGTIEPSHVLRAIGLSEESANASARFSFGRFNTDADPDRAVHIIGRTMVLEKAT